MQHIVGKLSTRVTTQLNPNSSQEVMGVQSGGKPNFMKCRTPDALLSPLLNPLEGSTM
jgi:hypothetical protein